jgi:hypothetical protein
MIYTIACGILFGVVASFICDCLGIRNGSNTHCVRTVGSKDIMVMVAVFLGFGVGFGVGSMRLLSGNYP